MQKFARLIQAAHEAGVAAAEAHQPRAMVVGHAKSLFGNEIDRSKPTYVVPGGVCGFAWVNIKPGNCKLANWMKKNKFARPDSYYGGVTVRVAGYGQSMEKKEAYGRAYAEVIQNSGEVKSAYMSSRMD